MVCPRLAGLLKPRLGLECFGLLRPATLWLFGVVPLEPLIAGPLDAVIDALGDHQVAVGVLAATGVDGQRVRQALGTGQVLGELGRQRLLLAESQLDRQGKFDFFEQPPIGAFMQVGSIPVVGGPLDELRHVPGFGVQHFIHVAGILAFALDVVGLGLGRLAARPAAGFRRKVINRHAAPLWFWFCFSAPCNGPRRAHRPEGGRQASFLKRNR
jgi:hypothetical protein